MKIELSSAGKRFNREWIFRDATLSFQSPFSYAITGNNGSGKSTLLQCIGGMLQLSEGTIRYESSGGILSAEQAYKEVAFCAPYLSVIEEMTLIEFLHFHSQFKSFLPSVTVKDMIAIIGLEPAAEKQIRLFSSGMKQRVRLAQAIFSNTGMVLLDEPCSNLDAAGIELYQSLINNYCRNRLVIVSSNDPAEYHFCEQVIPIQDFKKRKGM